MAESRDKDESSQGKNCGLIVAGKFHILRATMKCLECPWVHGRTHIFGVKCPKMEKYPYFGPGFSSLKVNKQKTMLCLEECGIVLFCPKILSKVGKNCDFVSILGHSTFFETL